MFKGPVQLNHNVVVLMFHVFQCFCLHNDSDLSV